MSGGLVDLFQNMRLNGQSTSKQMNVTWGELTTYRPTDHSGRFKLPAHPGDPNGSPEDVDGLVTGFIPIGTMFAGPGFGMRFVPPVGAQGLVIFLDNNKIIPVCGVLLFNDVDTPPWTDMITNGWEDDKHDQIKTTEDGKEVGDGAGGARIVGAGYASVIAPIVELGANEGLTMVDNVVRRADLQAVIDQMNAAIMIFNSHTHPGVTSGPDTTAPPATPEVAITTATASSVVSASE